MALMDEIWMVRWPTTKVSMAKASSHSESATPTKYKIYGYEFNLTKFQFINVYPFGIFFIIRIYSFNKLTLLYTYVCTPQGHYLCTSQDATILMHLSHYTEEK